MTLEQSKKIPESIVRIQNIYSSLRESEKKVCDYIKENYSDIIHLSITELAERSNSSEATVVRLCKSLGYKGYQEFKIKLAQETIEPTHQIHEELEKDDDIPTIKNKVFNADIQALYDTLKVLDDNEFQKAVNLISKARNVEFCGIGGSGSVALDAQHKFLKIGVKSSAYLDSNLQAMSASLLGEGDVVIAISHSGESKSILEVLKIARKVGASTITITNYGKSSILKVSDVVLYTASKETAFKSDAVASRLAELVIIDALFASVAFSRYEKSYENITKTREATTYHKN